MATKVLRADVRPPVSPRARVLLGRADALLSGSVGARNASDQFLDCYMAALRGAAAILEATPVSTSRARSRSAWVLLVKAAPELEPWAEYFRSFSATRAALQAGASRSIDEDAADDFYREVGRFLHVVEECIGADSRLDRVALRPRSMSA
ncbi:MAG: SAV_6107 family HEPN domain-containing protein [Rhodococcus sp. (in: high G+C Gram-positive bacteria)]